MWIALRSPTHGEPDADALGCAADLTGHQTHTHFKIYPEVADRRCDRGPLATQTRGARKSHGPPVPVPGRWR